MNQLNLSKDLSGVDQADRSEFILQHENVLSYKIDGTVSNTGSLHSFEQGLKN